jgi:glucose dehydrogenase
VGRVADNVYPYRIGFSTAMSRQFAIDRERSERAGFMLEFLNSAGRRPDEIAFFSRLTGEALARHVRAEFGTRLGIRVYAEQLPNLANAISLDPRVKDYFGSPAPHIAYQLTPYERDGLDAARRVATKILQTAGATDIGFTTVSPAAHQIGTHRMGTDPRLSVVDPALRTHDVDNLYLVGSGCFVTASVAPPTLTIAALALRAAEYIKARVRAG